MLVDLDRFRVRRQYVRPPRERGSAFGLVMIEVACPHCDLALAVREATAGRKFQCPACLDLFTVPIPAPPSSGQWRVQPLNEDDKNIRSRTAVPGTSPIKPRRKRNRKQEWTCRQPSIPSNATLWVTGIALLLLGVLIGLVAGHRLFSRPDSVVDEVRD